MGTLFFVAVVLWILWCLAFRGSYFMIFHSKPRAILLPEGTDKEGLFNILNSQLSYPAKNTLYYDENGFITIEGTFGEHKLTIEGNELFVGRDTTRDGKNIEEAECIDAYIRKIFDSNASVNPYKKYKKMKFYRENRIVINIAVVLLVVVGGGLALNENGFFDSIQSKNISSSYLPQYSSSTTIGEAFDNFFSDGKWSNFKRDGVCYVDYKGTCMYLGQNAEVIIRFWSSDTEFRVSNVIINGEETTAVMRAVMLEAIYADEDESET